jgi:hypothetical protein
MVTISRETGAQTEARLRGVFRDSAKKWLPGSWCFLEAEEASLHSDAIADIRDENRLSAICPAVEERTDLERFGVFRVVLPPAVDDSGFVGWLASRIKAVTGGGVFVVCGHDRQRGGVFDYYGVPEAIVGEVQTLLERLDASSSSDSLDGVVMAVHDAAAGALIGPDTVFCFDQDGTTVTARYGGGLIADGWLAGAMDLEASLIRFRYLQLGIDGTIDSGHSTGEIERLSDGRWQLIEHFTWSSQQGSGTNRLEEVAARRGRDRL